MFNAIRRLIIRVRTETGISRQALADAVGVSLQAVSRWETGERHVPEVRLASLAAALGMGENEVRSLWTPQDQGYLAPAPRILLPQYPVKYSLADVPTRIRSAVSVSPAERDELEHGFPRDTAEELSSAMQFLREGGAMAWGAPLDLGCRLLVVQRETERAAGHMVRHLIRLQTPDRELIAIPQTSLIVVSQSREYRVDFLVRWTGHEVCVWADLEIDGPYHADVTRQDDRRAYGLRLPRLTFSNEMALRDDFVKRVIFKLRGLESDPKWNSKLKP